MGDAVDIEQAESDASDVLVIGAGPAGLATAACLLDAGLRPQVIERADRAGSSWHSHYRRLHLHTVREHSGLPLLPFPAHWPRYVPRQQVAEYLETYARHFGIAPRFGESVTAIRRDGASWETACSSGRRYRSRAVVIATGANNVPNAPSFPGQQDYQGRVLHSRDYGDAAPFAGRRVLVVGMGNTGAEIALDLAEQGVAVTLAVRSSMNMVRRDVLGRPTQVTAMMLARLPHRVGDAIALAFRKLTVGDLRRYGLRLSPTSPLRQLREQGRTPVIDVGTLAMIKRGRIAVRPGIETFTRDGVRFTDGRADPFDAVILATGYRPALETFFPGVTVPVDANGMPPAMAGSGALAGVYFVGFDIRQPGGLLRTIGIQARAAAAAISRDLARVP
jgi:cation diffusion facilitator CzcD-associated flavoprotein CzcO